MAVIVVAGFHAQPVDSPFQVPASAALAGYNAVTAGVIAIVGEAFASMQPLTLGQLQAVEAELNNFTPTVAALPGVGIPASTSMIVGYDTSLTLVEVKAALRGIIARLGN